MAWHYIAKRLLLVFPVMWGVSLLVFSLVRVVPGSAIEALVQENVRPEVREILVAELGLDRPFHVQYVNWISDVLRFDLGTSFMTRGSVSAELMEALPVTIQLATMSVGVAILIGIPAGVLSARRQDSIEDYIVRVVASVGQAAPNFWVATLLIVLPALWFGYFPPLGYVSIVENPLENLRLYILPALALGLALSASTMRFTRAQMLEVLRQDYVRTARAKGLPEQTVLFKHSLKNALIPVVTVIGGQIAIALGGSVVIENVFGLPGIGRVLLGAILDRDYPMVQGGVLLLALIWVLVNLIVDITYTFLDPRISYK